jgi:predicted DNA-binding transcriptional regulator AlpA
MRPKQFKLTSVKPTPTAGLLLRYADGERFEVGLVEVIERHPTLSPLKDPQVFGSVKVGDHGASVIWANDDELELSADNLRARAVEQAGGISHEFIWNWMAKHDLTLDTAAEALGMSRRMLAYYRSGAKPVPRTVALACLGWEDVLKIDRRPAHNAAARLQQALSRQSASDDELDETIQSTPSG